MGEIRRRMIVRGVVQGVGFRFFARRHAERLGIRGFVSNQRDGTVLVEAEGSESQLRDYLACLKQGPSSGLVDEVAAEDVPFQGDRSFSVE